MGWAENLLEHLFTYKGSEKPGGILGARKENYDKQIEEPVTKKVTTEEEPPLRSGGSQYKFTSDEPKAFEKAKEKARKF